MIEFKPITRSNQKSSYDKMILDFSQRLETAGDDFDKKTGAINYICRCLYDLHDETKIDFAIEHLGKVFRIKKNIFRDNITRIAQEFTKEKDPADEIAPQITRVEKYITHNFDFRFNTVSLQYQIKKKGAKDWEDFNVNNIWRNLQKKHIDYSPGKITALLKSDFTPRVNPVQQYFKKLAPWDKKTDHIGELIKYIFIYPNDKDRFERMFRKMFVRSIAAAFARNFNKHALILVGNGTYNQNSGKTTFLRWLLPPDLQEYMTEDIKTDKDGLMALAGNFWINLDELADFTKQSVDEIKSFMSRDRVKVRIPYDAHFSMVQRISNFVGSTNNGEFLKDPTGSVRWICFKLFGERPINWNYQKDIDINKVWAQAYALFQDGFNYQLTREEIEENERANVQFYMRSTELELIQTFLQPSHENEPGAEFLNTTQIIEYLSSNISGESNLVLKQEIIGRSLVHLKFEQTSKYFTDKKYSIKGYWVIKH